VAATTLCNEDIAAHVTHLHDYADAAYNRVT
jgi:hypothetical protein